MPQATFNSSGAGSLPAIDPDAETAGGSPTLQGCAVTTIMGDAESEELHYRFPTLDGASSIVFGRRAVPIAWRLQIAAGTPSQRINFENKLAAYLKTGRVFTLTSEHGDTWENVRLRKVRPQGPPEHFGATGQFREYVIEFLWMQPGT